MTTADRIRNRRLELGLTQLEVAKKLGLTSKAAISKVENQVDDVTLKNVEKFAKVLDCSPAYLMGWVEEETNVVNSIGQLPETIKVYYEAFEQYAKLNDADREIIDNMIQALASKR